MTASAAAWPLTTAPSIVAGRPVSIQSPARNSPGTSSASTGRGGWPGATENVARFSRTTTARRSVASRAAGQRRGEFLDERQVDQLLVAAADHRRSAPLETSERCDVGSPNTARLSNTHCIVRPGSPTNVLGDRRSNQRLTVTIGDAAVDSAA